MRAAAFFGRLGVALGAILVPASSVPASEPGTDVGLKVADAPVGRPLTPKLTAELKPPRAPTLTVKGTLLPWTTAPKSGKPKR